MNALLSYWYARTGSLPALLERYPGVHLFLDSGAWSAHALGKQIDVHDYGRWLVAHRDLLDVYATLDVIGDPAATARHTAILQTEYGLDPLPVFHINSPLERLAELCARHDYIALGGIAGKEYPARRIMPWLIRCFRIAERTGTRFHGFGVTDWLALGPLPWRSVDSTSWMSGARYGSVLVYRRGKLGQVRRERIWRYAADLAALGFDAAEVARAAHTVGQGSNPELLRRVALASLAAAEAAHHRRHGTNLRIYLAGVLA